jgi:hypothetical protein
MATSKFGTCVITAIKASYQFKLLTLSSTVVPGTTLTSTLLLLAEIKMAQSQSGI